MKKLLLLCTVLLCSMHSTQYCSTDWKKDVAFNKSRCYEIFEKLIHFFKNTKKEKLEQLAITEALRDQGKITIDEYLERIHQLDFDEACKLLREMRGRNCKQYKDRYEDFYTAHEEDYGKMYRNYEREIRNYKG